MKNIAFSSALFIIIVFSGRTQIGDGSLPATLRDNFTINVIADDRNIELNSPSVEDLIEEDQKKSIPGVPNRVGINISAELSLYDEGRWTFLPNGDKICRLIIHMKHAKAIGLYFEEGVKIPEKGSLHVFDPQGQKVLGAFTSQNDGFKALEMITGETLVLEYYEPKNTIGQALVKIKQAVFFYKALSLAEEVLQEEKVLDCQVDVTCPEGQSWSAQRRSVVMYTYPEGMSTGTCTAVMVNNVTQDCSPYLLSASHCGFVGAGDDISGWVWYWNYEKNSCQPGTGNQNSLPLPSNTLTGGMVRGSSQDGFIDNGMGMPELQGTDIILIELNEKPPGSFNSYLSGWSKSTATPSSGVAIHHPDGGPKKIATINQITNSNNFFWCVQWLETGNGFGMLEPGSSGCPLFDQDKRVIAIGSFSFPSPCSINQTDCFGKISSSGPSSSANLSVWLDPDNTGATFTDGKENFCSTADLPMVQLKELKLYPNPANEEIFISTSDWSKVSVTDVFGHVLNTVINDSSNNISLTGLTAGYYVVIVELKDGLRESFQLIKQ
jgi:lysyl endopeptidase